MVMLAAAATAGPARAGASFAALGDEIVALVRDNFVDAARAEAWAAKHRGYGATADDAAAFATRTNELLAKLATSHTAFYPRGGSEPPMLSAVFQAGLKLRCSSASAPPAR